MGSCLVEAIEAIDGYVHVAIHCFPQSTGQHHCSINSPKKQIWTQVLAHASVKDTRIRGHLQNCEIFLYSGEWSAHFHFYRQGRSIDHASTPNVPILGTHDCSDKSHANHLVFADSSTSNAGPLTRKVARGADLGVSRAPSSWSNISSQGQPVFLFPDNAIFSEVRFLSNLNEPGLSAVAVYKIGV